RLPDLLDRVVADRVYVSDIAQARTLEVAPTARLNGRSRAFLKVQDGCQHRCAFCIVPRARGASRSLDPKIVLDQARLLVEAGHPEIVLTGVDLGHYGADLVPRTTLAALVRALVETPGLRWARLSSLLPAYFTPELLEIVTASPVVAPHFHIPLQSGSDRILRSMRRPYSARMYRALVERLSAARPGLGPARRAHRQLRRDRLLRPAVAHANARESPGQRGAGRSRARRARRHRGERPMKALASEPAIGVIGGSGLYELEGLTDVKWQKVQTPFGAPSDAYCVGRFAGRRVIFLPRHGRGHRVTPSELNFRANIWGFRFLGAQWVISISAVGSMKEAIRPLDLVVPDQFFDTTRRRVSSFFGDGIVAHVGMAE